MIKLKTTIALLAISVATAMTTAAQADDKPPTETIKPAEPAVITERVGDDRFELGGFAGIHVFAPDSELGTYDNDPTGTTPGNSLTFGVRLAYAFTPRLSLEGELAVMPTSSRSQGVDLFVFSWRAHVLFHLLDPAKTKIRPFVLVGGGAMTITSSNDNIIHEDTDAMLYAGAGVKFAIDRDWGVRLDARILFPPSNVSTSFTEDYEALLGVYGTFGHHEVKHKVAVVDPDPDHDGVLGDADKCPNVAGPKENDGCPDGDKDGDGIIDRLDKCPDQAGPKENDGCPDGDKDGDGIIDRLDKCPDKAGPKENDGCPDTDRDGDGIPDRLDKCPDQPETVNGYQDADGCPDEVPKEVARFTGVIKGINFVTGSAKIEASSFKLLDEAAGVLTQFPAVRLEISGHTDDTGAHDMNQKLSQNRADSVKAYLVGKGIAPERLTSIGHGPDVPVNPLKTAAARAQNRRVEFKLVTQ